ncbi:hypothetical protein BJ912DRAFT_1093804 [Pholiota molesta]|nr:hypothetical protein BJ912DRAFT_1093804 [Pholiota molesta]
MCSSPTTLAPRPPWHKQRDLPLHRHRYADVLPFSWSPRRSYEYAPHYSITPFTLFGSTATSPSFQRITTEPVLASYIRRLVFSGIWADGGELLHRCNYNLRTLDLTLDVAQLSPAVRAPIRDIDAEEFCKGLTEITSLTHIVVRKPGNVYLTQPKPRAVLLELAEAMQSWNELEHADIPFRLSDDSGHMLARITSGNGIEYLEGPAATLTRSLSTRPKLHTLSTHLPSVWNEAILRVSRNPALERISWTMAWVVGMLLIPEEAHVQRKTFSWTGRGCDASEPYSGRYSGIPSTGFFPPGQEASQACELIRAGTYITRTRAQTMGSPTSSPPLPALASSQSKSRHPRLPTICIGETHLRTTRVLRVFSLRL